MSRLTPGADNAIIVHWPPHMSFGLILEFDAIGIAFRGTIIPGFDNLSVYPASSYTCFDRITYLESKVGSDFTSVETFLKFLLVDVLSYKNEAILTLLVF